MGRMSRFFGFSEDNVRILRIARLMVTLMPFVIATVVMSSTFHLIFIAEALGGGPGRYLEGLALVGILVIIQLGFQTLLDYPTGAVGDWIGQRWIIASAYVCYGFVFYLTSLVTTSSSFLLFILIFVFVAIAASQESGAWMAWFDNNYRAASPSDEDRKQYGVFLGRSAMVLQLVSTLILIPGSILAVVFGRTWVFQLEAIMCFIVAIGVIRLVKDFPEVKEARKKPTMSEYTDLLKSGVRFLFSDPFITWFVIGGTLVTSVIIVWANLMLFPFYFLYLITDVGVATFRTILFFPGVFTEERSGVWSRRFEIKKWVPRFRLLQTCGFLFFMLLGIFMLLFPPFASGVPIIEVLLPFTDIVIFELPSTYILPIILMFFAFLMTGLFSGFANILTQRMMLDVIPNRIRNSVYSLIPTVTMILALPQIVFFGFTIQLESQMHDFGFPISLMLCALVSLVGVLMIRKGLSYPVPKSEEETWSSSKPDVPAGIEILDDEVERESELA
ncbi:MAG: MFS transporter [Candidatus Thorarchaeota archaeon]